MTCPNALVICLALPASLVAALTGVAERPAWRAQSTTLPPSIAPYVAASSRASPMQFEGSVVIDQVHLWVALLAVHSLDILLLRVVQVS
jgi:hypothetical protein